MRWEVRIDGPRAILRQLALAVSDQDIQLVTREEMCMLSGSRLDSLADVRSVRHEAERIITILSSSARLSLGMTESIQVADVTDMRADDSKGVDVEPPPESPHVRNGRRSTLIDWADHPDAWPKRSSLSKSLREALSNPVMEQALRLRNADSLTWTELVRIYEIIEKAAGGMTAVTALCGVPRAAIERLRHASNSMSATGEPGPLGAGDTQPSPDSMTLAEARSLVDRLLMAWLSSATRSRARQS
jgi:hypothetical protein